MRKVFAWLGVAALFTVMSRAEAANDVLKPYVVMILDTSGSMGAATGSGPTSCGKRDTRINHAVCAINSIVNSYGEMVFSLGRFREISNGTYVNSCDANGDQAGNVANSQPSPSGGDQCNTQGFYCGDCNPATGTAKGCSANVDCFTDCLDGTIVGETACVGDTTDDDGDGIINDGCGIVGVREGTGLVGGGSNPQCYDNLDNDGDGTINDGCPAMGTCDTSSNDTGCHNADNGFQVLTPLVDGNNAQAAEYTDGVCNTCTVGNLAGSIDPEIWGVSQFTYTPTSSAIKGVQEYWEGSPVASDGSSIWPATLPDGSNNPGFDPINRDPAAAVFLPLNDAAECDPRPNQCVQFVAEATCGGSADEDGDLRVNDGCPTVNGTPETEADGPDAGTVGDCADNIDSDGDGVVNDGCMAWCNGTSCCCATQCRPYITILLTDGGETCTTFDNTKASVADLLSVSPNPDVVAIATIVRASNVVTITTPAAPTPPHPFKVGDEIRIVGTGVGAFVGGPFIVTTATDRTLTYASNGANVAMVTNGPPATSAFGNVRHTAFQYEYTIKTIPIGFGIPPGDPQIEDIAHSGGAVDVPGIYEGYYAQDEADLELAVSQILADSVRAETCNNRDDDCDTRVDEDFEPLKDEVCTNGEVGACVRTGTYVCLAGDLACNAPAGTPGQEICNLIDDDCDGFIDETIERGAECTNGTNDDVTDAFINDGCPAVGTAELLTDGPDAGSIPDCQDTIDSDGDGVINDGCPGVGSCNVCVPTTEICDNADNDCDGVADQSCRCVGGTDAGENCSVDGMAGGPCTGGTCACTPITRPCGVGTCPGVETCTGNNVWTGCTADEPELEQCDGDDDDCDGVCDGIILACSTQAGACTNTRGSCPESASLGSPLHYLSADTGESGANCTDNEDDDLDGFVNDGCPTVSGTAETACDDAADSDSDGAINDGCPVPSLPIAENVCRPGSRACAESCTPGNTFSACLGEIGPCVGANCDGCNGLDDDCDNKIDENFLAADCSTNCGIGQTRCVDGNIVCNSTAATGDATCDAIDDDCDLEFDEDWLCIDVVAPIANPPGTVPASCDPCGIRNIPGEPFNPLAICNGAQKCVNGDEICDGTTPNPESCNCMDDDCDGVIDEDPDPTMGGNQICGTTGDGTCVATSCQCAFGCAEGEFPCPLGKKCEDTPQGEFCVNDPCFNITCGPVNGNVQTCIPKPGFPNEPQCVDVCSLINDSDTNVFPPCGAGSICVGSAGECRVDTCETFPDRCTENQACVNGQCVTNPCQGVTCDGGQYCLGGECVSSCADVSCPSGQRCRQGACETDPCGKQCPFGQACNDSTGQCIEDPCKFRNCPQGQWCNPNLNACEDDPCVTNDITCPNAGEVCRGGTCLDPDQLSVDAAGESHVTVGGGGGCNTSGGSGGFLFLLGALGLLVSRRRRTVGGAQ